MNIQFLILAHAHVGFAQKGDTSGAAVAAAAWSREDDFYPDTTTGCLSQRVFGLLIEHLLVFDGEAALRAVDERQEFGAGVHRANDEIIVGERGCCAIPIVGENILSFLHILTFGI